MSNSNTGLCECEHISHDHDRQCDKKQIEKTPNGRLGHPYMGAFPKAQLTTVKTIYGEQRLCNSCHRDCYEAAVREGLA